MLNLRSRQGIKELELVHSQEEKNKMEEIETKRSGLENPGLELEEAEFHSVKTLNENREPKRVENGETLQVPNEAEVAQIDAEDFFEDMEFEPNFVTKTQAKLSGKQKYYRSRSYFVILNSFHVLFSFRKLLKV